VSSLYASTINTNYLTVNSTLTVSTVNATNINVSTLRASTIIVSTLNASNINVSTLRASTIIADTIYANSINTSSLLISLQQYNSNNISSNYGKNILLTNSTSHTVNLQDKPAIPGTFINFINWSGVPYNIITNGPVNNYLNDKTYLTAYYTDICSLKWIAPACYIPTEPLDPNLMVMHITVSSLTSYSTMILPFGGIGSIDIFWGDGTSTLAPITDFSHTYPTRGAYQINISGQASSFGSTSYQGASLITNVSQWGAFAFSSLAGAAAGAVNLISLPQDIPSTVLNMSYMFDGATSFNQDISTWNTSSVKNMDGMFNGATIFNQPLSTWNTSSVTTMRNMFNGASSFNQNISSWNTSNVTDMAGMFDGATIFDKPLNTWNVSSVTDMFAMFKDATSFNQPLNNWNTSSVTIMAGMFDGATIFDKPLNTWNTSSVTEMSEMFKNALSFNQDISNWSTSNVTDMIQMFQGASSFNQNLSPWNVTSVVNSDNIFCGCPMYNQIDKYPNITPPPDSWGCYTTSTMVINILVSSLASYSTIYLPFGGINSIDVVWGDGTSTLGAVTPPTHPYTNISTYTITIQGQASSFGSTSYQGASLITGIPQWGTLGFSSLAGAAAGATQLTSISPTIPSSVLNMSNMFNGATSFNQSLKFWSTLNVTNMNNMFNSATSFNQNISSWNTSSVINMSGMFDGATSFNQPLNTWNTSSVTDMSYMFDAATSFNQDISSWNTSKVTNMTNMFVDTTVFNQPLNNWNVSSVNNMLRMFAGASSFNQPLNNWNTSSVTNMSYMFSGATSFNRNISSWNVSSVLTADFIFCGCPVLATPSYYPKFTFTPIWGCPSPMIINIATTIPNKLISLPFGSITDLEINWGDGSLPIDYTTPPVQHTYVNTGSYPITISGSAASFGTTLGYPGADAISTVSQWGTLGLISLRGAFTDANSLLSVPNDIPPSVKDTSAMFFHAGLFNQNISSWNTSNVSSMNIMFFEATTFNQNISVWNVSSVSTADRMFCICPNMLANAAFRPKITYSGWISSCS
jgi:surface protein